MALTRYARAGNKEVLKKCDVTQQDGNNELITPKKLINPVKDSKSYRDLHHELVLNHKRGFVLQNKPELQRVMEQRKFDLLRQQDKAEQPISDFEEELQKRYQKLQKYEQEQQKLEEWESVPEFIKVKESLRRTKVAVAAEDGLMS
ncbi:protein FAM107B-like [Mustelus asterias]